jgi:hypothetical protein
MADPWMLLAVAETSAIAAYVAAPVVSSTRDALVSMGDSVEQDVEAGDDGQ